MTDLVVRPAAAGDEDTVVALWRACGLTVPWNDPVMDFRRALGREGSDILVGELAGAVVASAMVGHDGHRGWLYYVATDPACRGRGFGRHVTAAAEDWVRAQGIRKIMLMVRATNTAVLGFYDSLDFAPSQVVVLQKWLDGTRA
ncbi:GNAT family acetyltransferase [Arenibaculum pallidiluteum]|uniref:GNAT family acetyltransferase n=1 Tax=Arenibaculum pallidiluteum TaxID=2812559 RepID=UPI001A957038|nr:GNAT family acetyltransferase [Arenibaculum pallidiluteum]